MFPILMTDGRFEQKTFVILHTHTHTHFRFLHTNLCRNVLWRVTDVHVKVFLLLLSENQFVIFVISVSNQKCACYVRLDDAHVLLSDLQAAGPGASLTDGCSPPSWKLIGLSGGPLLHLCNRMISRGGWGGLVGLGLGGVTHKRTSWAISVAPFASFTLFFVTFCLSS